MECKPLYISNRLDVRESVIDLGLWGFRVLPIYEPTPDGCSCGRRCTKAGKHPRIATGLKAATADVEQISDWWTRWPQANVGIATGTDLTVVDIDGPEGEAAAAHLDLPTTVEVRTGRGRHLYFTGASTNRVNIRPHIDIRGEGGYVIAPPSVHASGSSYEWVHGPDDHHLAPLPTWVTNRDQKLPNGARTPQDSCREATVREGERNNTLFRAGCLMRTIGMRPAEIHMALLVRNLDECEPPLEDIEVEQIAMSASGTPSGLFNDSWLLDQGLPSRALAVFLALRERASYRCLAVVGLEGLRQRTGLSRSTVIDATADLEASGIVEIKRPECAWIRPGVRASNEYQLLDPNGASVNNDKRRRSQ